MEEDEATALVASSSWARLMERMRVRATSLLSLSLSRNDDARSISLRTVFCLSAYRSLRFLQWKKRKEMRRREAKEKGGEGGERALPTQLVLLLDRVQLPRAVRQLPLQALHLVACRFGLLPELVRLQPDLGHLLAKQPHLGVVRPRRGHGLGTPQLVLALLGPPSLLLQLLLQSEVLLVAALLGMPGSGKKKVGWQGMG